MASYIEFPIFTGVAGELRPWILWLEAFFVREKFTKLEKMNLAQSLLEGKANAWFYRIRKRFAFKSWEHLVDHLIWKFGDFSDPELLLLFDKNDRLLQKQIDDAKLRRMSRTAITPQESISSPAAIHETNPVDKFSNQQVDDISGETKDESHEATLVKVSDSLEEESITQNQVPVASLEPSLRFSCESLVVSDARPSEIVRNNRVQSQSGLECVKNKNNAHHVFDELLLRRHKFQQRKKPSLSPKSRMFKFKNRTLLSNWSQMDLHQVVYMSKVNNQSPCCSANFGLVRTKRPFQCLRLKKQAHLSRVQYHLRRLHDPGGKKDEHFDEIFETEVDIGKVQRTQMDIMAESVITAPDNVAPSTDVIPHRQNWNAACDVAIDALDRTATWIVVSLPANKIPIGCKWVSFAVHALFLHQISWFLQLFLDDLKSHMKHKWKSKHLQAVFDLQNNLKRFAEGEIYVQLQESVRGCDVFLVQPTCPPANENLMELLVMIDTCLRASDNTFTAVIPYFGYARADRTTHGCEYIAAYHEWHRWKHKTAYLQGLLEFVVFALVKLQDIDKEMGADPVTQAHKFTVDTFGRLHTIRLTVLCVLCLLSTLFWRTSFKKQKFGKNWWYKFKHGFWQRECGKELLEVEVVVAETMVDVRCDDVGRRELLIKWQDHVASEDSWMFSKDFVHLYPSFKLEDKLVLQGWSIDTIQSHFSLILERRGSCQLNKRLQSKRRLRWKQRLCR